VAVAKQTYMEGPMSLRVSEVVIDCAEHGAVVDFWQAALEYERHDVNEQYVGLAPREKEPGRPPMLFQKVPEPKVGKNRVHLDLHTESRAAEIKRLVGLGAAVLREGELGALHWTVMADPEGNEFCVSDGS